MAQKYIVELVDDLDGSTADQTITFALDGKAYAIDLNDDNATDFRDHLKPYVDAAHKADATAPTKVKTSTRTDPTELADMRAWAKDNFMKVADRGRISAEVQDAYRAAH